MSGKPFFHPNISRVFALLKSALIVSAFWLAVSPSTSLAVVTLRAFPNYFRTTVTDPTSLETAVFTGRTNQGGVACSTANPSFSTNSTCDSCAKRSGSLLGSFVCNSQEIHPALPFQITIRSSDAADYVNCAQTIVARVAGGTTIIPASNQTVYTAAVAEQDVSGTFTWAQLCGAAKGDPTCTKSFDARIEFGFDRNCNQADILSTGAFMRIRFRYVAANPTMTLDCQDTGSLIAGPYEGICNYIVSPGDEKVFITNTKGVVQNEFKVPDLSVSATDTADASGMNYSSFRVYYRPTSAGAPDAMTYADSFSDLAIEGTGLREPRVNGLTNGVQYAFWGAMVDQGGNVTHFPALSALKSTANQIGTPEKVFGLLDEKGCFIATAAYGTPMAQEIETLRSFRDIYLAQTEVGREVIRVYYKYSPAWAAVIADNELLRTSVRWMLSPVVEMADFALKHTAWFKSDEVLQPAIQKVNP